MEKYKESIAKVIISLGVLVGIFLIFETIYTIKQTSFVGFGLNATKTITVTGQGKISRAPDTAKISFSVEDTQKKLVDSESSVSKKVEKISADLATLGVAKADITTDNYSSYPEYDYATPQIYCLGPNCPNTSSPVLKGYKVSHSITISVKDLTKTDDVLALLGRDAVTNISGPNFGFADDKVVAREARDLAISDARTQAVALANSLGVKLGHVVSFNEQGGNNPVPMMYAKDSLATGAMAPNSVSLPIGNTQISSSVSITYEIR